MDGLVPEEPWVHLEAATEGVGNLVDVSMETVGFSFLSTDSVDVAAICASPDVEVVVVGVEVA